MVAETAVDGEPEGTGAPDGAAPLGKDSVAQARRGGKEGHDHAQHLVGELAEAVVARQPTCRMLLRFWLDTPELVVRLTSISILSRR